MPPGCADYTGGPDPAYPIISQLDGMDESDGGGDLTTDRRFRFQLGRADDLFVTKPRSSKRVSTSPLVTRF